MLASEVQRCQFDGDRLWRKGNRVGLLLGSDRLHQIKRSRLPHLLRKIVLVPYGIFTGSVVFLFQGTDNYNIQHFVKNTWFEDTEGKTK
ncbi:hypothetical protein [Roseofilum casamattae]|uniref:Uncharacterized protein n=1 Tax=Roseofilum casamattae BLCC-M143 TaxID=3022442 RepID=A0ABT7C1Q5_9CYAN|nr:hypothetical protein [Roseofilum casamattae]MDJ1184626.1 hypothetical protein [Roseofilum casamattae BLCC-M143]